LHDLLQLSSADRVAVNFTIGDIFGEYAAGNKIILVSLTKAQKSTIIIIVRHIIYLFILVDGRKRERKRQD